MKKFITITAIVILLFNFISVRSYAAVDEAGKFSYDGPLSLIPQEIGEVTLINENGQKLSSTVNYATYSVALAFKVIIRSLTVIPHAFNQVLDIFVEVTSDNEVSKYTIYDTVMGHYDLFDIDYINIPERLSDSTTLIQEIKYFVIRAYRMTRNLSIAISLFVLIYIGIRMAISTAASDKAKYKNMLLHWATSLVIVFLIHLIVIVISVVLQLGLSIVEQIAQEWEVTNLEEQLFSGSVLYTNAVTSNWGMSIFSSAIIIWILAFYQIKFFIYYLKRTLEVNFLIVVSPLVTITYSIDKSVDNKAQAFAQFMKMLVSKSAIQLLHAAVYVVFIATAGIVALRHPILAILFFAALSRTEKIASRIFSIDEQGFQNIKLPFINK